MKTRPCRLWILILTMIGWAIGQFSAQKFLHITPDYTIAFWYTYNQCAALLLAYFLWTPNVEVSRATHHKTKQEQ